MNLARALARRARPRPRASGGRPPGTSFLYTLAFRLAAGAGLLTLGALLAATLVATGAERTRDDLDAAVAAERRINHLSVLSSRIAGYGLLRMEGTGLATGQLAAEEARILDSFDALDREYAVAVAADAPLGLDRQTATATRAMGLAQMRAAFDGMRRQPPSPTPGGAEAALAQASGVIGPAVSAMIEEEYRLRTAAFERIERLRDRLLLAAISVAALSVLSLALFLWGVLRPTLSRLETARAATRAIAAGDFDVALPDTRDEFGPLFRETRALAGGLKAERHAVDRDTRRLNRIVEDRTAALTEANRRLQALDADRQRFFADVSHELRTPLTVILSETELARRTGEADVALGVIDTRARRLMRRIEDLLRLSRSADGRLELVPVPVALRDVAETVAGDAARRAGALGVAVEVRGDPGATALVDPDWTRQVVASLVDNALRHAAGGKVVALDVAAAGGQVLLSVTDAGPGTADTERIFARFERGTTGPGFGIGLSFARWVVEAQGGTIRALSPVPAALSVGSGPGFRIELAFPAVLP